MADEDRQAAEGFDQVPTYRDADETRRGCCKAYYVLHTALPRKAMASEGDHVVKSTFTFQAVSQL